jgi:hypothetical protein
MATHAKQKARKQTGQTEANRLLAKRGASAQMA